MMILYHKSYGFVKAIPAQSWDYPSLRRMSRTEVYYRLYPYYGGSHYYVVTAAEVLALCRQLTPEEFGEYVAEVVSQGGQVPEFDLYIQDLMYWMPGLSELAVETQ